MISTPTWWSHSLARDLRALARRWEGGSFACVTLGARLSLAECYEKSDPLAAWRVLEDAANLAYINHDERLGLAEQRASRLEKRLPNIRENIPPSALEQPGFELRIDGELVDAGGATQVLFVFSVRIPKTAPLARPTKIEELCGGNSGQCTAPAGSVDPERESASTTATISTASFIVGGLALIGGGVLYFTAPSSSTPTAAQIRVSGVVVACTGGEDIAYSSSGLTSDAAVDGLVTRPKPASFPRKRP